MNESPKNCWYEPELLPRTFCTILGTALPSVRNSRRIESTTNDMVLYTWKVFHTTATN